MECAAISHAELHQRLEQDGCALVRGILTCEDIARIGAELDRCLAAQTEAGGSIRGGAVVAAARNLLDVWPGVLELARHPALAEALVAILGSECGLVRGLFFDKPPGQSWALPWHKDLTIAVAAHRPAGGRFAKPRLKAGVPHVEAPECVLEQMLTARLHLDDAAADNGPLLVIPGSHRLGKRLAAPADGAAIRPIHARAGDVLFMRPLLTHSSGDARSDTARHRRVVHLEFAATLRLPDGYAWRDFRPVCGGRV